MDSKTPATPPHRWRFFRSGGFDQVALESADDLRNLATLDPKLWTALSCPTTGLEFDPRTLALLDIDQDGQIRVPEVLAAVEWTCRMLKDPQVLFDSADLTLDSIDDRHADGATLKTTAARLLDYLGKAASDPLTVADFADMTRLFAPDHPNGDGVVPARLTAEPELQQAIEAIIATVGGVKDRSGEPGITRESLADWFTQAEAMLAWHAEAAAAGERILPLGDRTAAAAAALAAVREKIEDYFARCRLAAFDARAAAALNPPATVYEAVGTRLIATDDPDVAALPLAAVVPGAALPLRGGINPAWSARIDRFNAEVLEPLLGARDALTAQDWASVCAKLEPFNAWQAEQPETQARSIATAALERYVADDVRHRLLALIDQDAAADTSAANIDAVERLVHYRRDLVSLLRNFVTLSDFYSGQRKAIFQAGTLYLDQRSCDLVLRVTDMARHATLAPFSGCYLVYCTCERADRAPITIVAALTGGDVDELMVPGRNGVFYDRDGADWKATVVRIVAQPVSIQQAFWSPYRRFGTFIENQLRNFAASRDKAVEANLQTGLVETAGRASAPPPTAAPPPFDIARFAGIFAAIGLAIGAIGTALTAAISGLFALAWWQLPLVVIAILLSISGPSMLLAYLTLRRRNLGPLLDANGWALNARARVNIPFGGALTDVAALPAGSRRSLSDPFAERKRPWKTLLTLIVLTAALAELWRRGLLQALLA